MMLVHPWNANPPMALMLAGMHTSVTSVQTVGAVFVRADLLDRDRPLRHLEHDHCGAAPARTLVPVAVPEESGEAAGRGNGRRQVQDLATFFP